MGFIIKFLKNEIIVFLTEKKTIFNRVNEDAIANVSRFFVSKLIQIQLIFSYLNWVVKLTKHSTKWYSSFIKKQNLYLSIRKYVVIHFDFQW